VLHAFGADERVGHLPDFGRLAPHYQHLQAMVVIEMNVEGGKDGVMEIVLDIRELLIE
jgi:hypothetical protein